MTEHEDTRLPRASRQEDVRAIVVSLLIGVSLGAFMIGLMLRLEPLLGRQPSAGHTVVAVSLLLIAIGIRLPHQIVAWVSASAWRLRPEKGRPAGMTSPLDRQPDDIGRNWVLLTVALLFAGLATALVPVIARIMSSAYAWLQERFVWSVAPLVLLRAIVVVATATIPLLGYGLVVATAHRMTWRTGMWDTRASAWILIGGGLAVCLIGLSGLTEQSPNLCLVAAALPALVASVIAAGAWPGDALTRGTAGGNVARELPLCSDRWPTLLRAGIVSVSACCVWVICTVVAESDGVMSRFLSLAAMLGSAGLGILLGGDGRHRGARSIGGFGVVCVVAGMLLVPMSRLFGAGLGGYFGLGDPPLACLGVAALGYATAYGRRVLLARVAHRAAAGTVMLFRVLAASAFVVWVLAPIGQRLISTRTSIMGASLLLLAQGGILMINEPTTSARTRVTRVGAVFGLIAAMIGLAMQALPS